MPESKGSTATSISRKQISERIGKGFCHFCGDMWEKDRKQR